MSMRIGSVRARAALGATVVVALVLVGAGLAVLAVLGNGLADDARLRAEAGAREAAARVADVPAAALGADGVLDDDRPVQAVGADGRVLGASEELRGRPPIADFDRVEDHGGSRGDDDDDPDDDDGGARPRIDRSSEHGTVTLPVDDDGDVAAPGDAAGQREFSVVAVQTRTADGTPVTVYAAASLADREEAVSSARTAMLAGLPPVLAVVAAVTWLVTRGALRPVEGIRRGMEQITASTDLSRRVPEPAARDEIARLARTTNETLAALQSAVERQRRFVADASHELRSPIASLRTQLEVGAAHPELLDLDGAVQDTVRLQALAADLLLLARLDAGERPADTAVNLTDLVRAETAARASGRAPVHTGELAPARVRGSRGHLARVLGNLLDNARRHAAATVRVSLHAGEGEAVVEVADDGAGVPEGDRERIFERFVRLDDARSRDEGGAGLGLAIARDLTRRHGGTLTVGTAPEGGALFVLRLPMTDEPGG